MNKIISIICYFVFIARFRLGGMVNFFLVGIVAYRDQNPPEAC